MIEELKFNFVEVSTVVVSSEEIEDYQEDYHSIISFTEFLDSNYGTVYRIDWAKKEGADVELIDWSLHSNKQDAIRTFNKKQEQVWNKIIKKL